MYILLTGFMILNLFFSFIDYIVVGAADFNSTMLTQAISANTTTLPVQSTSGFMVVDWVRVGDEKIAYNGITNSAFLNDSRGYDSTDAIAHNAGDIVYGRMSDAINSSVGFNIIDTGASVGSINIISEAWRFIKTTVPSMVTWNFYWMKSGFWQYLRLIFFAISTGLIFVITIQLMSALGGLLQRAFTGV